MTMLLITLLGGIGATARFVCDGLLRTLVGRTFPWSTLIINVIGSFVLGVLMGMLATGRESPETWLILGVGFCGGFTTFSTSVFESVRLIEERRLVSLCGQVCGTLLLAVGAAAAGLALTM